MKLKYLLLISLILLGGMFYLGRYSKKCTTEVVIDNSNYDSISTYYKDSISSLLSSIETIKKAKDSIYVLREKDKKEFRNKMYHMSKKIAYTKTITADSSFKILVKEYDSNWTDVLVDLVKFDSCELRGEYLNLEVIRLKDMVRIDSLMFIEYDKTVKLSGTLLETCENYNSELIIENSKLKEKVEKRGKWVKRLGITAGVLVTTNFVAIKIFF